MTPIEIIALNFVSALIGFLIGNKLSISRDKRKEFNDLIIPIRSELIGIRNNPYSNLTGSWGITFALIKERLPIWERKGFDRTIENYKKSKSSNNINTNIDEMGGWSYKDTALISHCVDNLLKYIKPK